MKSQLFVAISIFLITSCSSQVVTNINQTKLVFSEIKSNYILEDLNNYGCEEINISSLEHVLMKGVTATLRDIHDNYSTVGCSIDGTLLINSNQVKFTFDYGGVFYFSNDLIVACGKLCCKNDFKYCTWEPN